MNRSVAVALVCCYFTFLLGSCRADTDTLKLVHVLFRHGNRNPDQGSLYPSNPYYDEGNYTEGYGQLTNEGKVTEYAIGTALRSRYDSFLTKTWNINYLDVRSTNTNRTKMSALLMLAGLYPARTTQIWSSLLWLPIPYNYVSSGDKEMMWFGTCSQLYTLVSELYSSSDMTTYLKRYKALFAILMAYTDLDTVTVSNAFNYYFGFAVQEELGFTLEDWVSIIYPEPIHAAAVDYYYFITNTTALRTISAGYLLRKIIEDSQSKVDGSISPETRKMFIYSGHEMNVAAMLLSLGVKKLTDIPAYGSYVLFELHEIDGVYGFKIYYQLYEEDDPIEATIPGCGTFCSLTDFISVYEDIIPTDDTACTG
ncbi:venom acid phosphatase Acph-1-like [Rhynchophorus ferrugineus]|uniref:acid phosphatase n=1 Tax=Rhynchophorus ferrugineus TaxID=354439 RepID=A0A834M3L0_RHYFE|nr:hypothetical protein GWI33_020247 [Rhynchophorus ferrugineus]